MEPLYGYAIPPPMYSSIDRGRVGPFEDERWGHDALCARQLANHPKEVRSGTHGLHHPELRKEVAAQFLERLQ